MKPAGYVEAARKCGAIGIGIIACVMIAFPVCAFAQDNKQEEAHKYLVRGMAAIEMAKSDDDFALAVEQFKRATEVAPELAAAWFDLGKAQAKTGQLEAAIASYKRYLALAPEAKDTQKVQDEITKLEFMLEQKGAFESLSGQWISAGGRIALVTAKDGKLTIGTSLNFPGECLYIMRDLIAGGNRDASPYIQGFVLVRKGANYVGYVATDAYTPGQACTVPPQKSEVIGKVTKDKITLKLQRTRFVVTESYDGMLSTQVLCTSMDTYGTMDVEVDLTPLPAGGILKNAAGLQPNDEIISVNGTELAKLTRADHIRMLRGTPGTTARLVVKRMTDAGGFFSSATYGEFPVTVPFVDVNPANSGIIGIEMQTVTPEIANAAGNEALKGAFVKNVAKDSPAEVGGLRNGDIIVAVDRKPITSKEALYLYLSSAPEGTRLTFELVRDGKTEDKTVTSGSLSVGNGVSTEAWLNSFYSW